MTSKHPIEPDELMAYLDGELATNRATVAAAHLEQCSDCQVSAAELRDVSRDLMEWEIETRDANISAKIADAFAEQQRQRQKAARPLISAPGGMMARRWPSIGAFAILCVVVGLSLKLFSPNLMRLQRATGLRAPEPYFGPRTRTVTELTNPVTILQPGAATDSNGLIHGLGDHAENSFSADGQPGGKLQQFAQLQNPPNTGPMVVRNAGITLTTSDFESARASLDDIVRHQHGYLGELNLSTPSGSGRSFNATVRVPADQLDATLVELRKLGRVESESQSAQEVTAQYVDLEARLTNARNTESRLSDLLRERTGKLSDVLAFEKEIDRVRGEIESMEAERKSVAHQVDFASIAVNVSEVYRAQLQLAPVSTPSRIRNAAVEGYRTLVDGVVAVILFVFSYGPSVLLWVGITFFPARFAWRKFQKR